MEESKLVSDLLKLKADMEANKDFWTKGSFCRVSSKDLDHPLCFHCVHGFAEKISNPELGKAFSLGKIISYGHYLEQPRREILALCSKIFVEMNRRDPPFNTIEDIWEEYKNEPDNLHVWLALNGLSVSFNDAESTTFEMVMEKIDGAIQKARDHRV